MSEKNGIQKMREATWNGVLPGDNNAYTVGPKFVKGKKGEQDTSVPSYPATSKAGIKVSDLDLISPIGRKSSKYASLKKVPDYTNTNYPEKTEEDDNTTNTNPGDTGPSGSGTGSSDGGPSTTE